MYNDIVYKMYGLKKMLYMVIYMDKNFDIF